MSDIVERLRRVETAPLHGTDDWVELWRVLQDARAEIARLRLAIRRLAEQDATLSVCEGNVTVTLDATPEILAQLSQRGGPLVPFDAPQPAPTDAEREAIREAAGCYIADCDELLADGIVVEPKRLAVRDALAALLERLGGGR